MRCLEFTFFIFPSHKWPSSVRFYFPLFGINTGHSFSNKTQYVTCRFCESGEFHIMYRRSKFPVQTCYPITHSIAFRSHLTSKWIRRTPDESDPAPSFNSIQFSIQAILAGPLLRCHGQRWQVQPSFLSQYSKRIRGPLAYVATLRPSIKYYWIMLFFFHYSIKENDWSQGDRLFLRGTCWLRRTNVMVGCHGRAATAGLRRSEYGFCHFVKDYILCFDLKSGSLNCGRSSRLVPSHVSANGFLKKISSLLSVSGHYWSSMIFFIFQ